MEIIGYPNYLIYEDGKVFAKGMPGQGKNSDGRFMKPWKARNGYMMVKLFNNQKSKNLSIHRLIGIHFIPNPNNLPCIDHIDRNKKNNNKENLRWCTYQTNNRNLGSHGKIPHKHISQYGKNGYYRVAILGHRKFSLKTLEDAIAYRDTYLQSL